MQYYTGQKLDMESITRHAVDLGIPVGWDLAHAVGRIIYLLQFLQGGRGHLTVYYTGTKMFYKHALLFVS